MFTHLHVHSQYSILDGLPKIDQLLDYVKELGMSSVALTDHGVLYGAVEFYKEAKKRDIKPIIGSEIYVARNRMEDRRPNIDRKSYHMVLLVRNKKGYENLVKLITEAHLKGFYYKPRVDEELLEKYSSGLIALSACVQGKIPQFVLSNKNKEAEELVYRYKKLFGEDGFYLELQDHPNIEEQNTVNNKLIKLAKKTNTPLVATCDSHYLRPEDAETQDILMSINTGSEIDDPDRATIKKDDFSLRTAQEMNNSFKHIPEAISNTEKIAQLCQFDFELGKTRLPHIKMENGETENEILKRKCLDGAKERYQKKDFKKVEERLNEELEVIWGANLSSYFLIVQDFVYWAKSNKIVVGPGRGSAGGSIIAYLLGITNIDPLYYDLLFERFLNPGRAKVSLPDIDLDFADRRRDEVIGYIAEKYGHDKVAQIITFGTMAARAAVRDVGRVLKKPYSYCDKLAKMIPLGSNLEETIENVIEFRKIYNTDKDAKEIIDHAKRLEGVVRHASTHACGLVISDKSLYDLVPLQHPTQNDDTIVTQYEMHAVESLGLLKMDLLGLKNLTIIEDTLKRIYAVHKKNIDIEKISLNDKNSFKLLKEGKTVGVFQLESQGMQRYLKQLEPGSMEDIIAMVSLYRPGPIKLIPDYIQRKHGRKEISYIHPKLKPILEPTYGVIVYQEQVMRIARDLAGYSLTEADTLRKAIGKKIKELLQGEKKKFTEGIEKNGIDKKVGKQLWEWIEPFAQYSFNKSHATAYALIAYQTAYLKSHYPKEFMSALLTADQKDTERVGFLIAECRKMGLEVLSPDINESFIGFSIVPDKPQIRFGLSAIKNVGMKLVEEVVKERKENGKFSSLDNFLSRMTSQNVNKKSMESLIKSGAFDNMKDRGTMLYNLDRILEYGREKRKNKNNGQVGLFEGNGSFGEDLTLEKASPINEEDKLMWEKELLGLFITGHPLEPYKEKIEKEAGNIAKAKRQMSGGGVRIGAIVSSIKKIITKSGDPMFFVKMEDQNDSIEVIVFPRSVEENKTIFEEGKPLFISGK